MNEEFDTGNKNMLIKHELKNPFSILFKHTLHFVLIFTNTDWKQITKKQIEIWIQ